VGLHDGLYKMMGLEQSYLLIRKMLEEEKMLDI
jgi:hypothetical protein